jgi:hypothetical protein
MVMRYERVQPISREEAEEIFRADNKEESALALLRLTYHDDDWRWVQDLCLNFLNEGDINIQALAITCLGHLARIHGVIEFDKVIPQLEALLDHAELGGRASDALDDIRMFAGK